MADDSAANIRGELSTQLNNVSELQDVKTGRFIEFSGFPACRIYLNGVSSEIVSSKGSGSVITNRTYSYSVDIFQELASIGINTAEDNFQDAIDAVLDKLHSNPTLNGNAERLVATSGSVIQDEFAFGPSLFMPINVDIMTQITT